MRSALEDVGKTKMAIYGTDPMAPMRKRQSEDAGNDPAEGGIWYTPYECPISANQNDRKLDVFKRKLE